MRALRKAVSAAGAILAVLPLLGCARPDLASQRAAEDDLKCVGYGITVADPAYPQCRTAFARQRAQQQQNALNALALRGAYLPQQAPYLPDLPGAMALGPPPLTSCWPTATGWNCYTQNN